MAVPWTVAVPAVGFTSPSSIRSVVVFPAPFGPRKPTTRPSSTVNDRSSTATILPKCLVSPETSIAWLMIRYPRFCQWTLPYSSTISWKRFSPPVRASTSHTIPHARHVKIVRIAWST